MSLSSFLILHHTHQLSVTSKKESSVKVHMHVKKLTHVRHTLSSPYFFAGASFFFFSLLSIILLLPLSVMCYECMFNVYALTASCSILLFFSFLFLTVVSLDEVAVLYAVEALTLQLPSICWLRIRCWCCCSLFFFPRSFSVPSLFSYVSVLHSYGAWYVHIIIYGAKKIGRSL